MMSHMAEEARQAPEAVARFLDRNGKALAELGRALRAAPPPVVITSARGSSDHAAGYFKYLLEILTGVPCASIGASVVSVYGAKLRTAGALSVTFSQSGKSPDIVALQAAARAGGARAVAFVNVADSPAGAGADHCLPLEAGPELSVAATKSFIVSLVAGAALIAAWIDDADLRARISALPDVLARACRIDWPEMAEQGTAAHSLYVLGRGPALPIASEVALKFKETCAIHAEAYSSAEVLHGPLELLEERFPVIAFVADDAAAPATAAALARMRAAGGRVVQIGVGGAEFAATGHPLLDPISMIQTAYLVIERVARARGRDPDRPRLLQKVTETR